VRLSGRTIAILIYAASWVLRAVFVLQLRGSPLADVPIVDEHFHVQWASMLAAGDWIGSEVFFRAPLYPYTLGLVFVLFKGSLLAARFVQVTYGALVPVAVYWLGRRLLGARGGIVAGIIAALYPFLIYFTNELLIESLVVVLDTLLLVAVLRADDVPSWGRWLGAGVLLGLAAIARPTVLVFAPCVLLWIWWRSHQAAQPAPARAPRVTLLQGRTPLRATALRFAFFLLGAGLVIAPVTLRNYALSKDFVMIASQGGVNFFIGNNTSSDGASAVLPVLGESWDYAECVRIAEREEGRPLKPSAVSGFWYRKGREFILRHPRQAAALFAKKLVLFWNRWELPNNKDVYHFSRMSLLFRGVSWLHFGVIAPLAALGAVVSWRRRRREAALLALFVGAYMMSVVLFFVCSRFRIPVVPPLIVFAAAGILWLWDRARGRDLRAIVRGVAVVGVAAALVNPDFYGTHLEDRTQTHCQIGYAYAQKGDHEAAIAEFRRGIEVAPGRTPARAKAYDGLGYSLEQLGREAEALDAYRTAAEVDPQLATAPNNVGAFYMRKLDHAAAVPWLEEAVRRDPWLPQAQYNLGLALFHLGDVKGAEEHFTATLVADARFKEAWNALGVVFEDTGRAPEGIAAYGRAIQLDPGYAEARNNLGVLLAKTGQYSEALLELEAALQLAPGNRNVTANIAQVRKLAAAQAGPAPGR